MRVLLFVFALVSAHPTYGGEAVVEDWDALADFVPKPYMETIKGLKQYREDPAFRNRVVGEIVKQLELKMEGLRAKQDFIENFAKCACPVTDKCQALLQPEEHKREKRQYFPPGFPFANPVFQQFPQFQFPQYQFPQFHFPQFQFPQYQYPQFPQYPDFSQNAWAGLFNRPYVPYYGFNPPPLPAYALMPGFHQVKLPNVNETVYNFGGDGGPSGTTVTGTFGDGHSTGVFTSQQVTSDAGHGSTSTYTSKETLPGGGGVVVSSSSSSSSTG